MNPSSFTLTKNEQEIMELLWSESRSLSRSEIIELSSDRSWKASSIHILLNQLLEKGAIDVDGFVKTGKNYGRTFSPSISEDEYQVMQFRNSRSYNRSRSAALCNFFSTLFQNEEMDDETITNLEKLLESKRGEKM